MRSATDPQPERAEIVGMEYARTVIQNEEHWVVRVPEEHIADIPPIGTELFAIPTHVCPTSALYPAVPVVENGKVTDDNTPTLRGKAEAGSTVHIYDGAILLGSVVADASGKWTYTPLVGDPADGARYEYGFGATRSGAANMVVYKNHLYLGGYNDPMVALPDVLSTMKFKNLYDDMSNPVNLWRMDADENFELVAGEDNNKYFGNPIGTIDGETMRAGLAAESDTSRHLNQYVWRMQSYDGKMYAGTFDISDLAYPATQFANGDILKRTPEEWKKQIEYIKKFLETTETDASGASTYALTDGSNADGAAADDIAKVQRMESLMQEMQGDLESKQTDVQADGTAPMALDDAEEYTIENREDFQKMLEELLALYQQVRPMLPDYVVEQLDKWLTQENVENSGFESSGPSLMFP